MALCGLMCAQQSQVGACHSLACTHACSHARMQAFSASAVPPPLLHQPPPPPRPPPPPPPQSRPPHSSASPPQPRQQAPLQQRRQRAPGAPSTLAVRARARAAARTRGPAPVPRPPGARSTLAAARPRLAPRPTPLAVARPLRSVSRRARGGGRCVRAWATAPHMLHHATRCARRRRSWHRPACLGCGRGRRRGGRRAGGRGGRCAPEVRERGGGERGGGGRGVQGQGQDGALPQGRRGARVGLQGRGRGDGAAQGGRQAVRDLHHRGGACACARARALPWLPCDCPAVTRCRTPPPAFNGPARCWACAQGRVLYIANIAKSMKIITNDSANLLSWSAPWSPDGEAPPSLQVRAWWRAVRCLGCVRVRVRARSVAKRVRQTPRCLRLLHRRWCGSSWARGSTRR